MKKIQIKQYEILVDDDDYQRVIENMKWTPSNNGRNKIYFYKAFTKNKKSTYVSLHRFIINCPKGMAVDHINGNTFDNRKENLRICTQSQNNCNVPVRKNNKTGLKGVTKWFNTSKYTAMIQINRKRMVLGIFNTPEEAYAAYCEASKKYHGEFGRIA
jgi:hypothetical protein